MSDSPICAICGQVESVEHQLFSCINARRVWELYRLITGQVVASLLDVIICEKNLGHEIVKSTLIKALIQIDRSQRVQDSALKADCRYFLNIEAQANEPKAEALRNLSGLIV